MMLFSIFRVSKLNGSSFHCHREKFGLHPVEKVAFWAKILFIFIFSPEWADWAPLAANDLYVKTRQLMTYHFLKETFSLKKKKTIYVKGNKRRTLFRRNSSSFFCGPKAAFLFPGNRFPFSLFISTMHSRLHHLFCLVLALELTVISSTFWRKNYPTRQPKFPPSTSYSTLCITRGWLYSSVICLWDSMTQV